MTYNTVFDFSEFMIRVSESHFRVGNTSYCVFKGQVHMIITRVTTVWVSPAGYQHGTPKTQDEAIETLLNI